MLCSFLNVAVRDYKSRTINI